MRRHRVGLDVALGRGQDICGGVPLGAATDVGVVYGTAPVRRIEMCRGA